MTSGLEWRERWNALVARVDQERLMREEAAPATNYYGQHKDGAYALSLMADPDDDGGDEQLWLYPDLYAMRRHQERQTPPIRPVPDEDEPIYKSMGDVGFERGSDTSAAAAASLGSALNRLEAQVLAVISGSEGLTDEEVEGATGLSHQCASARRRGLVLRGLVRDSGRRRSNRSGRKAAVWVLA